MAEKKSGLGEFWDNLIEENEKEKEKIQELLKKRRQEAVVNEDTGQSKTLQENI